ncbi:hypothetical protein N8979_01170 [bacterium]|nr:hypothetical protein [bacterium]
MLANSYIGVENAKPEIIALVKKTSESQFKIGEILKGLKDKVESFKKDDFKKKDSPYQVAKFEYDNLVENELPFGKVVANKLVQIASDKGIKKYLDKIPFSYNTMYDLIGMSTKQWNFYFKKGLTTSSTAKDIKQMKALWLEKTQPKVNEESTEQEVKETNELVKDLTGGKLFGGAIKSDVQETDEPYAYFKSLTQESIVEVIVDTNETNISVEQLDALQQLIDDTVANFFSTENVTGEYTVKTNPNILSDNPAIAA